jgi:hypothetical protein
LDLAKKDFENLNKEKKKAGKSEVKRKKENAK